MDLKVFNEHTLNTAIEIGRTYRPGYFAILLVQKGTISLKYNLSEYEINKNSVLFLLPNSIYEFYRFSADVKLIGIVFSMKFLNENGIHTVSSRVMEAFAAGFQPFYEISKTEFSSFLNLVNLLTSTVTENDGTSFFVESERHRFLTIFYEGVSIYRKYNNAYKVRLNRPQELSVNFLQSLSSHFREERSVQFYAQQLFVTSRHLTQTLKQLTGKTAGEFIARAVIMEAKFLLKDPSKNIGEVANMLHFSDQFFFSKFFKKHTGQTPTQFRAQS